MHLLLCVRGHLSDARYKVLHVTAYEPHEPSEVTRRELRGLGLPNLERFIQALHRARIKHCLIYRRDARIKHCLIWLGALGAATATLRSRVYIAGGRAPGFHVMHLRELEGLATLNTPAQRLALGIGQALNGAGNARCNLPALHRIGEDLIGQ